MNCRLHSGDALGYYTFGGAPTIVDPRQTADPNRDLTNTHEQAHRDLFNNTLYGYALGRLRELAELSAAASYRPEETMDDLAARLFDCAEGSATALEFIAALPSRPTAQVQQLYAALPDDYKGALSSFWPLVDRRTRLPAAIDLMVRASIVNAVAEAAADWRLLTSDPEPGEFWELVARLSAWEGPDATLPSVLQAAIATPPGTYVQLLDHAKGLALPRGFYAFCRAFITNCKALFLLQSGVDPRGRPLLSDDRRLDVTAAIDATLTASVPGLRRKSWTSKEVFGAAVQIDVQEPAYLLSEIEVAPGDVAAKIRELASAGGFLRFVNNFLRSPKDGTYALIAKPIRETPAGMDLAEPYLICPGGLDAEALHGLEQMGIPMTWMTFGIPMEPSGFYDAELVGSLRGSVYLHMPEFSWENARRIAVHLQGATDVAVYDLPRNVGLAVATHSRGRVTIFGLVPPRFPSDMTREPRRAPIEENPELGAVAMVVLRTSQKSSL